MTMKNIFPEQWITAGTLELAPSNEALVRNERKLLDSIVIRNNAYRNYQKSRHDILALALALAFRRVKNEPAGGRSA